MLLSPFDNLLWDRPFARRVLGFDHLIEVYKQPHERRYGYYVLPFLRGDRIVGRADLKSERATGELVVKAFHLEEGVRASRSARRCARPRARPAATDDRPRARAAVAGRAPARDYDPTVDFETRAIHAGQEPDSATGSVTTPIYQTSTFAQEAVGVHKGYDYARVANPTRTALEECLASLENADHGHAFSSGLGAATTIMHLVDPGDRIVCVNDVYGGIYRMFSRVYEPKGYAFTYLTPEELSDDAAEHVTDGTRVVWIETPTNPTLNIVDIAAVAAAAKQVGALLVVDNTFATPYLQTPLDLGADIVLHSTTKYLGGHSDVVGGFAATNDPTIAERLRFLQKSLGAVPGPFDAWLVLRGVKTLAVRMDRHCANARAVGGAALGPPARRAGALPGSARSSRARDRRPPDAGLRRHGLVPARERGGRCRARRPHRGVDAGRVSRWRGEPDRAPLSHDPCVDGRRALRVAAKPRAALGRDRVGARSRHGSRAGAGGSPGRGVMASPDGPIDLLHAGVERRIASYPLETDDGPALFDVGPTSTLPALEAGLAARGLGLAGRPAPLALAHPSRPRGRSRRDRARRTRTYRCTCPRSARRTSSTRPGSRRARAACTETSFDTLWGELVPVPAENVHVVGDSVLGLEAFPTPGHASHHVSYLDRDGTLYSGDAAGVRVAPARFVLPPLPPPEVDLEAWERTLAETERREPDAAGACPLRRVRRRTGPSRAPA